MLFIPDAVGHIQRYEVYWRVRLEEIIKQDMLAVPLKGVAPDTIAACTTGRESPPVFDVGEPVDEDAKKKDKSGKDKTGGSSTAGSDGKGSSKATKSTVVNDERVMQALSLNECAGINTYSAPSSLPTFCLVFSFRLFGLLRSPAYYWSRNLWFWLSLVARMEQVAVLQKHIDEAVECEQVHAQELKVRGSCWSPLCRCCKVHHNTHHLMQCESGLSLGVAGHPWTTGRHFF